MLLLPPRGVAQLEGALTSSLDLALNFDPFREELRSGPVRGVEGLVLLPSISNLDWQRGTMDSCNSVLVQNPADVWQSRRFFISYHEFNCQNKRT